METKDVPNEKDCLQRLNRLSEWGGENKRSPHESFRFRLRATTWMRAQNLLGRRLILVSSTWMSFVFPHSSGKKRDSYFSSWKPASRASRKTLSRRSYLIVTMSLTCLTLLKSRTVSINARMRRYRSLSSIQSSSRRSMCSAPLKSSHLR